MTDALLGLVAFALLALVTARVLPLLLAGLRHEHDLFLITSVASGLALAGVGAVVFGVPLALAAFVGGLAITESPVAAEARRRLLPFRDLFAVLFFVAIGTLVDPGDLLVGLPMLGVFLAPHRGRQGRRGLRSVPAGAAAGASAAAGRRPRPDGRVRVRHRFGAGDGRRHHRLRLCRPAGGCRGQHRRTRPSWSGRWCRRSARGTVADVGVRSSDTSLRFQAPTRRLRPTRRAGRCGDRYRSRRIAMTLGPAFGAPPPSDFNEPHDMHHEPAPMRSRRARPRPRPRSRPRPRPRPRTRLRGLEPTRVRRPTSSPRASAAGSAGFDVQADAILTIRRGGRVVEGSGLENRRAKASWVRIPPSPPRVLTRA